MRSFQVMRYGRRVTPTTNELAQSIIQSNNVTLFRKRRSSMFASDNEHCQNSIENDKNDDLTVHRRHTLNIQKPVAPVDGVNLSRRPSLNNGRRLSFQQQEVTESSKSKTNLRNFYVFFVLLFLFIFLAVVYSFIRMIKTQA